MSDRDLPTAALVHEVNLCHHFVTVEPLRPFRFNFPFIAIIAACTTCNRDVYSSLLIHPLADVAYDKITPSSPWKMAMARRNCFTSREKSRLNRIGSEVNEDERCTLESLGIPRLRWSGFRRGGRHTIRLAK